MIIFIQRQRRLRLNFALGSKEGGLSIEARTDIGPFGERQFRRRPSADGVSGTNLNPDWSYHEQIIWISGHIERPSVRLRHAHR